MDARLTTTSQAPGHLQPAARPARLAAAGRATTLPPERVWLTAAQTALSALFPPPDRPLLSGLLAVAGLWCRKWPCVRPADGSGRRQRTGPQVAELIVDGAGARVVQLGV